MLGVPVEIVRRLVFLKVERSGQPEPSARLEYRPELLEGIHGLGKMGKDLRAKNGVKSRVFAWDARDVAFVRKLDRIITLKELKAHPGLADFRLNQRGNRLSVFPIDAQHWKLILSLE